MENGFEEGGEGKQGQLGSWEQGSRSGHDEKWVDLECILQVRSKGLAGGGWRWWWALFIHQL